jgi:hypothetical protein
MTKEVLPATRP